MNKRMILFLVLATTIMLMPVVSIQAPQKKISCFVRATYDISNLKWVGYIVFPGETPAVYDITWYSQTARFVGHPGDVFPNHLEIFTETWEIKEGTTLLAEGYDKGIFSEDSWEFTINGKCENGYDDLAHLTSAQVHVRGIAWFEAGAFQLIGEMSFTGYGK